MTNDLAIGQVLGTSPIVKVHVLGGHLLRPGSHTITGDGVIESARALQVDVLLLGAHAVTDGVLSETDADVAAVKRALLQAARSRRLLADASKFRPRAFMCVCATSDLHELVTDVGLDPTEVETLRRAGLTVTQVQVGAA